MDITRARNLVLFLVVAGFTFYVVNALWSAFFITALPQDSDWCRDWITPEEGAPSSPGMCLKFKNEIEEAKHFHNRRMLDRNRRWVYGTIGVGIVIAWLSFYVVPRWRHLHPDILRVAVTSVLLGFASAVIVPMILSWLLPAPYKWFPRAITDAALAREQQALSQITGHRSVPFDQRLRGR